MTFQVDELMHLTQNMFSSSHPLPETFFFTDFKKRTVETCSTGFVGQVKLDRLERLNQ